MSLKFPFKFKHCGLGTVYTAKLRESEDEIVDVYWIDGEGREDSVDYYLADVVNNVRNGAWKMIEETTIDPLVEIRQSEYTSLIEEVNLLRELLAEANQKLVGLESKEFKPVTEYTMSDWEQALTGDWKFEQRDGEVINIIGLDYADTSYKVETESSWLRLDGTEYDFGSSDSDIIKRIK